MQNQKAIFGRNVIRTWLSRFACFQAECIYLKKYFEPLDKDTALKPRRYVLDKIIYILSEGFFDILTSVKFIDLRV